MSDAEPLKQKRPTWTWMERALTLAAIAELAYSVTTFVGKGSIRLSEFFGDHAGVAYSVAGVFCVVGTVVAGVAYWKYRKPFVPFGPDRGRHLRRLVLFGIFLIGSSVLAAALTAVAAG
ncbi:O-antigen/teichoic acid export membrane protein [Allocatelliglobosispora scoriae]|uniref:O-antigen/teichoic acid export membrane protein n=1 Tax=Allocatelliglobosispora scoriae TaxID=643052 RepID=A0A841C5P6_9ACTN|nr:hypothetical protein [Allocatelliglobosispora scoriae]MBB5874619.1 O-antigen/teichoic acid export membrane protein [Allocatelliglobosispora scoriae]